MNTLKITEVNWKKLLLSLIITLFLFSFINLQAAAADLNVSLTYREMIALGPAAEAKIMLVDSSKSKRELIVQELNKKLKGVPVNFNLDLAESEIDLNTNYQLIGLIKAGREMFWLETKNFNGAELLKQQKIELITKRTPARWLTFKGEKDLQVRFLNSLAQVIIDDQEYLLPQQRTASGAKFANSKLSIWNKGRELLVEKNEQSYQSSLVDLADFKAKSTVIKAKGQEPYWELRINQNSLELKYDYLANKIIIPQSNFKIVEKADSLVYQINTSFLDFEVKILENIHNDLMNTKVYPLTAFVKINGKKYIGGADLQ